MPGLFARLLGALAAVEAEFDGVVAKQDDFHAGTCILRSLHYRRDRLIGHAIVSVGAVNGEDFSHEVISAFRGSPVEINDKDS